MPRRRRSPKSSDSGMTKKKRLCVEFKAPADAEDAEDDTSGAPSIDECAICYDRFNFKTTLPACGHSFCFLCIKGVALRGGVCPLCRRPVRRSLFDKPKFQDAEDEPSCSAQSGPQDFTNSSTQNVKETDKEEEELEEKEVVQWFYEARRGGWWRFEPRQESDIEESFASGKMLAELLIAGYPYSLDLKDMTQYRKDLPRSPRWERKIKRVSGKEAIEKMNSPLRGVAGLPTSSRCSDKARKAKKKDNPQKP